MTPSSGRVPVRLGTKRRLTGVDEALPERVARSYMAMCAEHLQVIRAPWRPVVTRGQVILESSIHSYLRRSGPGSAPVLRVGPPSWEGLSFRAGGMTPV